MRESVHRIICPSVHWVIGPSDHLDIWDFRFWILDPRFSIFALTFSSFDFRLSNFEFRFEICDFPIQPIDSSSHSTLPITDVGECGRSDGDLRFQICGFPIQLVDSSCHTTRSITDMGECGRPGREQSDSTPWKFSFGPYLLLITLHSSLPLNGFSAITKPILCKSGQYSPRFLRKPCNFA